MGQQGGAIGVRNLKALALAGAFFVVEARVFNLRGKRLSPDKRRSGIALMERLPRVKCA
jgi:hypothetical protein